MGYDDNNPCQWLSKVDEKQVSTHDAINLPLLQK
jgi:hypothetical protein